jgi:hypothetical protein
LAVSSRSRIFQFARPHLSEAEEFDQTHRAQGTDTLRAMSSAVYEAHKVKPPVALHPAPLRKRI